MASTKTHLFPKMMEQELGRKTEDFSRQGNVGSRNQEKITAAEQFSYETC